MFRANLSPWSPVIILVVSEVHLDHGWGSKQAPPPTSDGNHNTRKCFLQFPAAGQT